MTEMVCYSIITRHETKSYSSGWATAGAFSDTSNVLHYVYVCWLYEHPFDTDLCSPDYSTCCDRHVSGDYVGLDRCRNQETSGQLRLTCRLPVSPQSHISLMWILSMAIRLQAGVFCWITAEQSMFLSSSLFPLLNSGVLSNFLVWMQAIRNKHFLVALATLMGLLALTFQPLAAALLTTKDTWWSPPGL